ncbi:hypothetical protein V8C40DRAFT_281571 [Trichoderma camerunense]
MHARTVYMYPEHDLQKSNYGLCSIISASFTLFLSAIHGTSCSANSTMTSKNFSHNDYKIGWICALSIEQTAAMAMLDEKHDLRLAHPNDTNYYTLGSISGHNVVIACLPEGEVGINSIADATMQMVNTFPSVRFSLMVGIGGGIPPRVRLGDVVVSRPSGDNPGVIQWDFNKAERTRGRIVRTGSLDRPPKVLLTALTKLSARHEKHPGYHIQHHLDRMAAKRPRLVPEYTWSALLKDALYPSREATTDFPAVEESGKPEKISIHYGLIASGNQVIKHSATRDGINKMLGGEVLCFEMEAAGLMNCFPCIVIRGICDYADSHKEEGWQEYAAAIASAYAKELLEMVRSEDVEREGPAIEALCRSEDALIRSKLNRTTKKKVILRWLTQRDYSGQHGDYLKKHQPGTGQWLLNTPEFQDLMSGTKKKLVCHGMPGAGKTILTSVVINHLQTTFRHDQDVGIAYIYFHYKEEGNQNIEDLLASLLEQLLRSQTHLPESTVGLFKLHSKIRTRPSDDELFSDLTFTIRRYKTVFFILDAMDECQRSSLKVLLSYLFQLQSGHDIRIVGTSRPIQVFTNMFPNDNDLLLLDIRATPSDVLAYLEGQMHSLSYFVRSNPELQEDIKSGISEAVDGMFLLAEIYITLLRDKMTPNEIRKALKAFRSRNQSKDSEKGRALVLAYEQTMERIQNQSAGLKSLALKALSWITLAKRNLTAVELQHALATNEGMSIINDYNLPYLAHISYVCAGLLTVDVNNNVIRPVHNTTQEYLKQTQRDWFPDVETMMSRTCITYISFDVFGGSFRSSDWFNYGREQYPFYKYAVNNWTRSTPEDTEPSPKLMNFLQDTTKVNLAIEKLHTDSPTFTLQFGTSLPKNVTGLHFAVYFGAAKVVSNMLELGYKTDNKDNHGRTPLWWAAQGGQDVIVKLLLDAGALLEDSDSENGHTPLMCAIQGNHQRIISLLLEKGSKVDSKDKGGRTPLIMASEIGAEDIVTLLLKDGKADINLRDSSGKGWTPLQWAINNRHETLVTLLLKEGANIEALASTGQFSDSGYASIPRKTFEISEIHQNTAVLQELSNEIAESDLDLTDPEDSMSMSVEEPADDRTEYSTATSLSNPILEGLISQLADQLIREVKFDGHDEQSIKTVCIALRYLLKTFALKIGFNAQSQIQRDFMYYTHKYSEHIADRIESRLQDTDRERNIVAPEITREMTKEWLNNLTGEFESYEAPASHQIQEDSSPEDDVHEDCRNQDQGGDWDLVDQDQGLYGDLIDPDHEEDGEESIPDLVAYRNLISGSPAYSWLLGILRRESLLEAKCSKSMKDINQKIVSSLPHIRNISKARSSERFQMTFLINWDPANFLEEQQYEESPDEAIEKAITLTGSAKNAQALTTLQYLHQTWPTTGEHVLQLVKDVMGGPREQTYTRHLREGTQLTAWITDAEFITEVSGTRASIAEIGEQLAWLSASLRSSLCDTGVTYYTPFVHIIKTQNTGVRISDSKAQCRIDYTVKGFPVLRRPKLDTGLEMPLNMMAALTNTQRIDEFNGKVFIKGFSTMLIPTDHTEGVVIWHLQYRNDGNHISYFDACVPHISINISDLEQSRNIVGWCSQADMFAGATEANYNVQRSGLPKPTADCVLHNVSISAGKYITGGINCAISIRDQPIDSKRRDYTGKLEWIHDNYIVLWDEKRKRGWLLNGTTALLHLSRAALKCKQEGPFKSSLLFEFESMEEATERLTAESAIKVLTSENNMKLKIYRDKSQYSEIILNRGTDREEVIYKEKESFYRFQDLVDDLYSNLEKMVAYQANATNKDGVSLKCRVRKHLDGWEFDDIIRNNDCHPRVATLEAMGQGWVNLITDIGAVVLLGNNFGEIIQPSNTEATCDRWSQMPEGRYYLGACVSDLTTGIAQISLSAHATAPSKLLLIIPILCKNYENQKIPEELQALEAEL